MAFINPLKNYDMKRFIIFAVCVIALALMSTSCYKPVVRPLGDGLFSFTKKVNKSRDIYGVKDSTGHVVLTPVWDRVYYHLGVIVVAKNGLFALYTPEGERIFPQMNFSEVRGQRTYFSLKTTENNYFYIPGQALCGPANDFRFFPSIKLLFAQIGENYGIYDTQTGEFSTAPNYKQIIYAYDTKNASALYVSTDGKTFKKLTDSKETPVKPAVLNLMKKEADANKTPWPKQGVGVVKLKTIR